MPPLGRRIPDVSRDIPCPDTPDGAPHHITAGGPLVDYPMPAPNEVPEQEWWRCRTCGVTWADLDAAVRRELTKAGDDAEDPRQRLTAAQLLYRLGVTDRTVKAWGRAHGHHVPDRGPAGRPLVEAYALAHPEKR